MDVADAVRAHEDADAQIHEQAGEPAARGDPDRRDGDEQDERADEQELVEVVDSQRRFPSLACATRTRGAWTSDTKLRHSGPNYFVTLPNS
ncbi:hypothetical protein GCM10010350_21220 [Streptomyces galilaeus]|nr:hypothetical protein GCM10010350_21220 [Streptomyces galilaeus]